MKASFNVVASSYDRYETLMVSCLTLEQAIESIERLKVKYPEFSDWKVKAEYFYDKQ